jgi:glycosyltransferase involved in cell wall biosynthesis
VRQLTQPAATAEASAAVTARTLAIVPALNEERAVGRVIGEIRQFDPEIDVLVIDDGSSDRTALVAEAEGARVVRLPFNLGIGGAMQTGFRYAFEHGFEIAVQIDGDGQHDASQLGTLLAPLLADEADVVIGSRFANGGIYAAGRPRRLGIRLFAALASLLCRQRLTDTTSGFRAVNRRGICLFARDYPHDYPEVEAIVMAVKQKLRLTEVPVSMRRRDSGTSSITTAQALYYVVKVTLAMVVGLTRKNVVPLEDQ